ncbi:MAG: polysaccharide biosynthesis tyrosine autokinase [Lewinellaceae bacterium]|nr:polysaccharide biosynthesis tyrosine autokinase [Saprospiraceae bacterium]MCB9338331.1 polysaccharide biosynthesis tyrosine autokinase [Lewinellaceae bacterium]
MSKDNYQVNSNLFKKCLSKWYWFVLCLVIALPIAWYMLAQEQFIWHVEGSIIIEEEKGSTSQLPEESITQGLPFRNRGNLDKQIQILKSRKLMERVVDSLNLDILYFVERRFKEEEIYKASPVKVASIDNKVAAYGTMLRVNQLDNNRFSLIREEGDTLFYNYGAPFKYEGVTISLERDTSVAHLDGILRIKFIPRQKVAQWYAGLISLQKQGQSNILSISLNDSAPQKLVDIVYELVDIYNLYSQEEKNKIAARSLDFITDRLASLNTELFSVEGRQAAYKSGSGVTTDVEATAQSYVEKLNTAETTRDRIGSTRNTLLNLENFLADRDNEYKPIPNYGDLADIQFASFIGQYNSLVALRKNKLRSVTPMHPEIIQIEENLNAARSNIQNNIKLAIKDLDSQEQQVIAKAAPVERKVQSLPFAQKKINEIARQVDVKQELVVYMLQKREETAIGLATQVESTRILDEPVISNNPVAPNGGQFYTLAFLLAMALPTSVIYLLDRMNDKISTKAEVKAMTSVPFLGEIAYAKSERSKLINANSRSVMAEMFRLIRTNLQFLTTGRKDKTILVTSNISGDGKTFVSANLAACIALTDKKTIILELDLRKPKLTEFLTKQPPTVGITNYLVGEKEADEIIQPIEGYKNLFLMSSGPTPPNPAELILSDRMGELFEYLKNNFDYVVVDTPPTGLVTDAYLLNKYVGGSVFVVRAGKTKKEDLKTIEEICKEGKLANPSIILNGVKMPKRYGYYY